ncbi:voltage-gated potassium channel [Sphingomonas kaistensis]|uniref:Voltage-gated potassium channel n=1 Tax=Sphingomonas kaistensis TaxID=298708 RepID=A0A7X5Y763_9SPHN|nr:potassium channel family protein [Sphingomonas kaistensis]NJC06045.1 voltage-gated potassium channel [Sphingomonas kaistensis]
MATSRLRAATDTLRELALLYVALLSVCAVLFSWFESRALTESLYWAATTATSTGYGDISAKTLGGMILSVFLMHASIFIVAPMIIVRLIERLNEDRHEFTHEEQERILATLARLEERLERIEGR